MVEASTDERFGEDTCARGPGTLVRMPAQPTLSPHLAEVVARCRARAEEMGELRPRKVGTFASPFTDEAREILAEWRRDGGYERALAEVVAQEPELADQ